MSLVTFPSRGLTVRFVPAAGAFAHAAAGEHTIAGAECPNCNKPMLRLLSLDTLDPRLELVGLERPFVHLLFCWTCPLAQGFSYSLEPGGGVRLLDHQPGRRDASFPWSDYPDHFPGSPVDFDPLADDLQARIRLANRAGRYLLDEAPRHQIGGEPSFVQGAPEDTCPTCGAAMDVFATLSQDGPHGETIAGNRGVQHLFTLCREDRVVTASHAVD